MSDEVIGEIGMMDAFRDLIESAKPPVVRIHINTFSNYSESLCGFIHGKGTDISGWFGLIRSAYSSAQVYGDDGEELFIVPAILERQPTNTVDVPVTYQIARYNELLQSSPIAANNYLNNRFKERSTERVIPQETVDAWNKLLAYYQEDAITANGIVTGAATKASILTHSDDEEDEGFL